jgi:hypothetical protein
MIEVRSNAEHVTSFCQPGEHCGGLRFAAPGIGAGEMSVQLLKTRLGIRHVVQHFADDSSPASNFARLIGTEVVRIVRFFLTAKSCTKASTNGCLVETTAEATPHGRVDCRRRRFRVKERPDRVEEYNGRKWK